jgi:hypothetical protein
MLRSALTALVMVIVLVLLPGVGSGVVLVMLTALVMEPAPVLTLTVSVIVPDMPEAMLAVVSWMLLVLVVKLIEPLLSESCAPSKLTPAALRLSVSVTLAASLGPALLKVIR